MQAPNPSPWRAPPPAATGAGCLPGTDGHLPLPSPSSIPSASCFTYNSHVCPLHRATAPLRRCHRLPPKQWLPPPPHPPFYSPTRAPPLLHGAALAPAPAKVVGQSRAMRTKTGEHDDNANRVLGAPPTLDADDWCRERCPRHRLTADDLFRSTPFGPVGARHP